MHRRFNAQLIAQVSFYICDHLFSIDRTEQIRFADENHGARAGLIKRLHDNNIIRRKASTRVDQKNAKIAARQIRDRLFRAGHRKRAKPGRVYERNTFRQTIGWQFNENPRDVLFVPGIFLLRRKFRQLRQRNDLRLRFGEFDSSFCDRPVANARWDCRDGRNADRQHVGLQNIIEQ